MLYSFCMSSSILQLAADHGFDLAGISPAALNESAFKHYEGWVQHGRAGSMTYMDRDPERRRGVTSIMPKAQSVICLATNYFKAGRPPRSGSDGQVARYAFGRDYHKIIGKKLKRLCADLRAQFPEHEFRSYVDTGPVLERSYAEQAGLGYIGKNTTLITQELGSYVFLSEILTTLPLEPTPVPAADQDTCGHCRLCLDICPTGALIGAGELDAKKCISYLTIENRGPIPVELRPLIGDWLYGCDLCQEICPKNNIAQDARDSELFAKRIGGDHHSLAAILKLRTKEQFDEHFAGSAMRRSKREGLVRNACVVTANIRAHDLMDLLREVAQRDESEMVREHAQWAIDQLEENVPNT